METTDKKPVNRAQASPLYRKKIKRMVETAKTLRGIPHGSKIPKGPRTKLKGNASESDKTTWAKENNFRLTIDTIHFFADTVSSYVPRREEKTPVEQALTEVAAEQQKK